MRQAYALEGAMSRSAASVSLESRAPGHGRILLVGTPRRGRARLTRALAASGYRTLYVCDGAEALIRLRRGGVAAVLLADDLPGIRGQALLPGIRVAWPELPVIFVRRPGETASGAEALASGAHACVVAPVRAAALLQALRAAAPMAEDAGWGRHEVRARTPGA